jgi:hypothetical protein
VRVHADFARAPLLRGWSGGLTADLLLQQLSAAAAAGGRGSRLFMISYTCVRACNIYIFSRPVVAAKDINQSEDIFDRAAAAAATADQRRASSSSSSVPRRTDGH